MTSEEELDYLTKLSRSRNQAASIVTRSKIVLMSYHGKNDAEISRKLKVDYKTVRLWIQRILDLWVKEGLVDKSRSGKPRVIRVYPKSQSWYVTKVSLDLYAWGHIQIRLFELYIISSFQMLLSLYYRCRFIFLSATARYLLTSEHSCVERSFSVLHRSYNLNLTVSTN